MKIEVGKRYVRRDGTVTPLLVAEGFWATDTEKDVAYGTCGGEIAHQVFSYRETLFDIVAEYNETNHFNQQLTKAINTNPFLTSLLYGLDLLPEQITTEKDANLVVGVVLAYLKGFEEGFMVLAPKDI